MVQLALRRFDPHGVIRDTPADELPEERWSEAQNFHFEDGAAVRSNGWAERFGPPLATPYAVYSTLPGGLGSEPKWLYAGPGHIGVTSQAGTFDLTPTPAPATVTTGYTFSQVNRFPTICNGVDAPWFWDFDEGQPVQPLPGFWSGYCGALRSYKQFLIAMDIVDGGSFPELLRWSDAAEVGTVPQTWTPAQDNLAGEVSLSDPPGGVVDGRQLRDAFVVYKEGATFLLQFIGGQFVMSLRKLFYTSGILNRNCCLEAFGRHFVLTTDDVIHHDGNEAQSIAQAAIRREIFNTLNPDAFQAAYIMANTFRDEIWICWPAGSSQLCNRAAVYDIRTGDWGFRDIPPSAFGARGYTGLTAAEGSAWDDEDPLDPTTIWDLGVDAWNAVVYSEIREGLIVAEPGQDKLVVMDNAITQDGALVPARIARDGLDFGNIGKYKLVQSVWPRITGTDGDVIQVRVGGASHAGAPVSWSPTLPFTIGQDDKVDVFVTGRLLSFAFESASLRPWRLEGFDVQYRERGAY